MAYKRIIRVEANENESSDLLARVENAKKIVAIESEQGEKGFTRGDQNLEKIQELIAKQMEVNATDKEAVTLNGKPVYVNKRRITSSFVQQTLGCSYNPIKAWFDNEANQTMLEKHHAKFGINESYNRLVSKALKQAAKE
jgi:hypothetical protein